MLIIPAILPQLRIIRLQQAHAWSFITPKTLRSLTEQSLKNKKVKLFKGATIIMVVHETTAGVNWFPSLWVVIQHAGCPVTWRPTWRVGSGSAIPAWESGTIICERIFLAWDPVTGMHERGREKTIQNEIWERQP